jgi:hypothetical protein
MKAIVLFGVCAALVLPAIPDVQAADLTVTRTKRVSVKHVRVVRDYDGTAVVERRTQLVTHLADGTVVVTPRIEMIPAMRATPRYYLNGQPVLPQRARTGWY